MTRSTFNEYIDYMASHDGETPDGFGDLDEHDRNMILEEFNRQKNDFMASQSEEAAIEFEAVSEEDSDFDHIGGFNEEITPEDDAYDEYVIQQKRSGDKWSPKKTFTSATDASIKCTNAQYKRDGDGNIDFAKAPGKGVMSKVGVYANTEVKLNQYSKKKTHGRMLSGNFVKIAGASRDQHFSMANYAAKQLGQTAGNGGNSPANKTWHHKKKEYEMHLVDQDVHAKFGHNGGFYFWK